MCPVPANHHLHLLCDEFCRRCVKAREQRLYRYSNRGRDEWKRDDRLEAKVLVPTSPSLTGNTEDATVHINHNSYSPEAYKSVYLHTYPVTCPLLSVFEISYWS